MFAVHSAEFFLPLARSAGEGAGGGEGLPAPSVSQRSDWVKVALLSVYTVFTPALGDVIPILRIRTLLIPSDKAKSLVDNP